MKVDSIAIELDDQHSVFLASGGAGAEIVLLHGALATHEDWLAGPFFPLAQCGRVLAVDLPGHGQSLRARFEAEPRLQAAQIHAALSRLSTGRRIIVGHSFGGLVALAYAEQFPEAVSHLVLLSPIALPEVRLEHSQFGPRAWPVAGPAIAGLASVFERPAIKVIHQMMFWPQAVPDEWSRRYPWEHILSPESGVAHGEDAAAIHPAAAFNWIDFRRIEAPARILTGKSDLIVRGERHARPLSGLLPSSELIEVEGVGHMIHHSRPDLLVAAVRDAS